MTTMTDPWATAPAEPEQSTPPPAAQDNPWESTPPEAAKSAPQTKVINQSGGEGKIVGTFKEGAGYEASWLVVHAGTLDEYIEIVSDKDKLQMAMDRTKGAAAYFRGGAVAPPKGGGGNRGGAPQGAQTPPPGSPPSPGPGWVYKTGVTKSGKNKGNTWQAWMPPQGSNEDPVWFPDN